MITKIENPNFRGCCFTFGNLLFGYGHTIISVIGGNGNTLYFHPYCAGNLGENLVEDCEKANHPGTQPANVKA